MRRDWEDATVVQQRWRRWGEEDTEQWTLRGEGRLEPRTVPWLLI